MEEQTEPKKRKWTNRFNSQEYEQIKEEEINFDEILSTKFDNSLSDFFACMYSLKNIANLFDCSTQNIINIERRQNIEEQKNLNIFRIQGYKLYMFDQNLLNNFMRKGRVTKRLKLAMKRHKKRLEKIATREIIIGNEN